MTTLKQQLTDQHLSAAIHALARQQIRDRVEAHAIARYLHDHNYRALVRQVITDAQMHGSKLGGLILRRIQNTAGDTRVRRMARAS